MVSSDFLVLGRLVFLWSIGPFNDRTIDMVKLILDGFVLVMTFIY